MTVVDSKPLCFYHPTKVIFLDDNRAFLDALELEFGNHILTLTNPDAAISLIDSNKEEDFPQSIYRVLNDVNADTTTNRVIDLEIKNLLTLIYDKSRFERIPLLVVDYAMPNINGIQFCEKIKQRKIAKVMLTAEADKDTVISAFNNRLIDKFILKRNENLYPEITLTINDLTYQYFSILSGKLIDSNSSHINTLFSNKLYQELFKLVKIQAQAIEYYLVDNLGSFLFLDKDANPTWLIIKDLNAFTDHLDLLAGYDLPDHVLKSVAKKEKMLFMLSEEDYKKPVEKWIENLFDAKKLDDNFYYGIIKNYLADSIEWGRVVSYSAYMTDKNNIDESTYQIEFESNFLAL
ncbi:response regulator [Legionella feeleii]|uniref:Response regulator receiver CheY-like n=1 Tax=Legionella feeleii TaxID=453 RepID=A0A0W0TW18_9GAMM|nr:response regulator [Legionella feeleii]KTC99890.1 Two component response regulator [Legionella feeleii]SPX61983.1 Response regulator receiver CheY-like [Legionella feeleii]